MANMGLTLTFGVTVADSDHWTPQHLAQAEDEPGGGYDDFAAAQLTAVMRAAGDQFIREHPDMFASTSLV